MESRRRQPPAFAVYVRLGCCIRMRRTGFVIVSACCPLPPPRRRRKVRSVRASLRSALTRSLTPPLRLRPASLGSQSVEIAVPLISGLRAALRAVGLRNAPVTEGNACGTGAASRGRFWVRASNLDRRFFYNSSSLCSRTPSGAETRHQPSGWSCTAKTPTPSVTYTSRPWA